MRALASQTINDVTHNNANGNASEVAIKGLFRESVYGICLKLKRHVLATHQELRTLRRCAEMLHDHSQRIVHVVAATSQKKTDFVVNTLMHLGVSCGQIKISAMGAGATADESHNIWLFVTDG
ncbi:MAG: hypothetical protein LJE85_08340 [Gammaproteobacteria bacterium]|jgi:hypothetical protein|nr:hypothetical protein [Gammaproteobacteria bacterium]